MLIYVLFVIGFVILIKGADLLVEGSSSLAKRYNIPDLIVGLTIVSFGTSMPELIVNVYSSLQGSSEIAVGNIIGSNISNVLLILGIAAIIYPLPIHKNTMLSEIPFSLTGAILVGFLANAALFDKSESQMLTRADGAILLFFFILFMVYIVRISQERKDVVPMDVISIMPMGKSILWILIGMTGLFLGGKWVVEGAKEMAASFGLSESFIGLTVVAIGTSLPELVTSAIAAYKRNTDIAVGNVIGSNIFNVLWILGLSSVIKPLHFDVINNTDILVLIFSSSLLIFAMATSKRNTVERWDGFLFVLLYIAYMIYLIYRG
ncbi:calcium/sodium antiporter [Flammeovirgaceae bacterium SG7u.111]|nr:calcium/sodium antiporter [Flammeovirgaceae bacterium SG7u.132]WPO36121.1 calcium/sodium antiporter [Flammeovirgaceae bacterium SG7u.111]